MSREVHGGWASTGVAECGMEWFVGVGSVSASQSGRVRLVAERPDQAEQGSLGEDR